MLADRIRRGALPVDVARWALRRVVKDKQWTLWTMSMKDRQPVIFGDVRSIDLAEGSFSPDGRWIAYQARESDGPRLVFVQPFPSTGAKYLVRQEGGGHPDWSAKGDEIILNVGPGTSVRARLRHHREWRSASQ